MIIQLKGMSKNTLGPIEEEPTNKQDQQRENVDELVIWDAVSISTPLLQWFMLISERNALT